MRRANRACSLSAPPAEIDRRQFWGDLRDHRLAQVHGQAVLEEVHHRDAQGDEVDARQIAAHGEWTTPKRRPTARLPEHPARGEKINGESGPLEP